MAVNITKNGLYVCCCAVEVRVSFYFRPHDCSRLLRDHTIRFRNSMQRFGSRATVSPGKIAQGHNSHQAFLAIQYRQTVYLLVAHAFRRGICGLIVKNVLDPRRHYVAYFATIRGLSFRDATKRDVPVSDHAEQAIVFPDGQGAAIELRH